MTGNSIITSLSAAADIMLPRYCIVCGRRLYLREKFICIYCLADFPFTYNWNMPRNRMADRLNAMIQRWAEDIDEWRAFYRGRHERYAYAAALFMYRGDASYKNIPRRLKYHGDIAAGRFFGRILGARVAMSTHFKDADIVIPVPLHWKRRWDRGYNQAEIIAREVASACGAAMRTDILVRNRRTRSQTRLNIEEKEKNVRGAFSVRLAAELLPKAVHILLVDDVFTTGATTYACFLALRRYYGPETRISVVTLACVDNG